MITAADVLDVVDHAERLGIDLWLDGGWAVDALVGRQSRPHGDLDIVLSHDDGRRLQRALGAITPSPAGDRRWDCVLGGHRVLVDPRPVEWDADGNGVLDDARVYPAQGFTGTGTIDGRTVRCIEPATLVALHTGYEHDADDQADVLVLCEEFGLTTPPQYHVGETFNDLLAEGEAIPTAGWRFSWFGTQRNGRPRASEERPPWGYVRVLADRAARADALLDLQTGGGEVVAAALGAARRRPAVVRATESWAPNLTLARDRLEPFAGEVCRATDTDPLPYDEASFGLVSCRHPVTLDWREVARVLRPGGRYLGQHVGVASAHEVSKAMLGPFTPSDLRSPARATSTAAAAGLDVVDLQQARLRMEFNDIAAFVYFCRKVVWMVPDFSVQRYRGKLAAVHARIERDGAFVAHATRYLIEAVKH